MNAAADTADVSCEGCGAAQHVGEDEWESSHGLDWCPSCWVERAPDEELVFVPMTRLQAKAAKLCIDTVVAHDTGLTPTSMPEAAEAIRRTLADRPSPK